MKIMQVNIENIFSKLSIVVKKNTIFNLNCIFKNKSLK